MSKSENNHDNSDLQMLKEEVSEKEYQNAQYEAEKKKTADRQRISCAFLYH